MGTPRADPSIFVPWITPRERARLVLRTVAAVLALLVIGISALWVFSDGPYVSDRPFDAEKWADAQPVSDDTRWRMRDDLRDNYLRTGMSLAEVAGLLGEGESRLASVRIYRLRSRDYLGDAYDELVIGFDGDDRLASIHLESAHGD